MGEHAHYVNLIHTFATLALGAISVDVERQIDDDVEDTEDDENPAHPLAVCVLDERARPRHAEPDEDRHDCKQTP